MMEYVKIISQWRPINISYDEAIANPDKHRVLGGRGYYIIEEV